MTPIHTAPQKAAPAPEAGADEWGALPASPRHRSRSVGVGARTGNPSPTWPDPMV